jgi:hypothetical protein
MLLDFNLGAGFFKLLLGIGCGVLGNGFLNYGRSFIDLGLGFLQAQTSQSADNLDDADLIGASFLQDYVEFSLLFFDGLSGGNRSGGKAATGAAAETPNFSSSSLMKTDSSNTVMLAINSTTCSLVISAILSS